MLIKDMTGYNNALPNRLTACASIARKIGVF
jgi:hypothetical protein